jgi:hypothetical protein
MSEENIKNIQKRAGSIHIITEIIVVIGTMIFLAALIGCIYLSFASQERFYAIKDNLDWSINYKVTNSSSFFIKIPFTAIQTSENIMFNAKHALLTCFSALLIKASFVIYGTKLASDFLNSIANDIPIFMRKNAKRIKRISYLIIIYSAAADILTKVLYSIFITQKFTLDLADFHLSGVLVGGLILVIADIFEYGVFLQQEFDAKL